MAKPTVGIAARIGAFLNAAGDVEIESCRDGEVYVLKVTMRMTQEEYRKTKPAQVSDGLSRYHPNRQPKVSTEIGRAVVDPIQERTVDSVFTPAKFVVQRKHPASLGPVAQKWDLHDAMKDEGVVATAPRKQRAAAPAKCRKHKVEWDEDGVCPKCAEAKIIPEELFDL